MATINYHQIAANLARAEGQATMAARLTSNLEESARLFATVCDDRDVLLALVQHLAEVGHEPHMYRHGVLMATADAWQDCDLQPCAKIREVLKSIAGRHP